MVEHCDGMPGMEFRPFVRIITNLVIFVKRILNLYAIYKSARKWYNTYIII